MLTAANESTASTSAGTESHRRRPSRVRQAVLPIGSLMVHAALWAGVLDGLPPPLRVAIAFGVLVLAPGWAFVRLGLSPPGGGWTAAGWAFGFGVAWGAVGVLGAAVFGRPFTILAGGSLIANALLWIFATLRRAPPAPGLRIGGVAGTLVLVATVVVAWHAARFGPVMTFDSDAPDHIGTVRRMMESGAPFPSDAFYRDAGAEGVDPRKGVWHPQVALIASLASVDPVEAWRVLPVLLAPLFVFSAAAFGRLCGGSAGSAIAAWGLLLTYGGSLANSPLRQAAFSSRVAEQLALAALVALLADLGAPSLRLRLATALLAFAAVTSHLFAALQIGVTFAALGLLLLIRDRAFSPAVRRWAVTSLVAAAGSLPFLLWRASAAYAPRNLIHTEPQGLLYLIGDWNVVSPGVLWQTFGPAWVLIPFALVPLWKLGRRNDAALAMLGAFAAMFLIAFNPLATRVLEPRLGYLMMRFTLLVPLAGLFAWGLPVAWRALREQGVGPRRLAGLALAGTGLALLPALADAWTVAWHPEVLRNPESLMSPMRWRDGLDWMKQHLPPGRVVLSDPVTSYSVPMMTGLPVVTLVDQHSSPNDARAVERLLDARDALDPWESWDRFRQIVQHYDVDAIVLNDRFDSPARLLYWTMDRDRFRAMRSRLDPHPGVFEPAFDTGDFVVYRVNRGALDTLRAPVASRGFVRPFVPDRVPAGRRVGTGVPLLIQFGLFPRVVAPGDTLAGRAEWRVASMLPPGAYRVVVRLDRELPNGFDPPALLRKPLRKVLEKLRGEKYRLRSDHLPVAGAYGVDRWSPDEIVTEAFQLPVPPLAAPGRYAVRALMVREPQFPNLRLSDYFLDDDLYTGVPVGHIEVRRPGSPEPIAPAAGEDPGAH